MTRPENAAEAGANPSVPASAGQPQLELRSDEDWRRSCAAARCAVDLFITDASRRWGWQCHTHHQEAAGFLSARDAERAADEHERDANHYIHGAEQ